MTPQLARLQRAGAEVIVYTGLGTDLAVVRRTMARLDWFVPLIANNASLTPPYVEGAGDLVVGTRGSMIAAFARRSAESRCEGVRRGLQGEVFRRSMVGTRSCTATAVDVAHSRECIRCRQCAFRGHPARQFDGT